jgi:hypothetical protein
LVHAKWWSLEKDHGDDGVDHQMIKCSIWKRRKRKTKFNGDQGKGIA